jgi:hypothetical protein
MAWWLVMVEEWSGSGGPFRDGGSVGLMVEMDMQPVEEFFIYKED